MISPIVGAGISIAAPAAGREALKLIDQATQTFASMLGAAADSLSSQEATTPDAPTIETSGSSVSIDSIRTLGKHLAAELHRRAMSGLEAAGVDTSREFSLRLGSHSEIIVMGDHPDKDLIEQVLNTEELSQLYTRVTGLQEIVHAYDERDSFRESFGRDPLAAVASYAQSPHDSLAGVIQLTLSDEAITVDFPAW
ncbi:MAG: hypothetical protein MI757_01585 [Pirellulales bacterium]|nr:hypothetical protein [Pirellulales bacterium]